MLAGCASMVTSATTSLADSLSTAIINQNDPKTVRDGAPAYLLLVDGLIQDDSDSVQLLMMGAKLYATYAGVFVDDQARARRLTTRARKYGKRALCIRSSDFCTTVSQPYDKFVNQLQLLTLGDVPALYTWAQASAGWIQAHSDDWNAIADLPKIEAAIRRVVELDENYDQGSPFLFLGVLSTLRPAAVGGKPEEGRMQFERAIELSGGRNLMAKVLFAKHYARLVFNQSLHDDLLKQVLASDPVESGYTLSNTIAQDEAKRLLATSKEYF